MSEYDQLTGSVLHGTYRLEQLIGEGGMGAVYAATHNRLTRRFAVKVLHHRASADPGAILRFKREAQVTSALGSRHIVDVVDFNVTPSGMPYIVMELLQGEDLEQRLDSVTHLELLEAARIFEQASLALHAAHRQGIIHRDLKPSNIFICREEEGELVKVLDFGISKILGDESQLTGEHALMGTPYYMAPEQVVAGMSAADVRTDIYAMGAILYEMLCGHPPFTGASVFAILQQIVSESPVAPRTHRPELPVAMDGVVLRALSRQPAERQPSVKALWRDLAAVVGVPCSEVSARRQLTLPPALQAVSSGEVTQEVLGTRGAGEPPWRAERSACAPPEVKGAQDVTAPVRAKVTTVSSSQGETQPLLRPVAHRWMTLVTAVLLSSAVAFMLWPRSAGPPGVDRGPQARGAGHRPPDSTMPTGFADQPPPDTRPADLKASRVSTPKPASRPVPLRPKSVALKPLSPATIQLVVLEGGVPVAAAVNLDGRPVGQSPLVVRGVAPGPHRLEATMEHRRVVKHIVLRSGKIHRVVLKVVR